MKKIQRLENTMEIKLGERHFPLNPDSFRIDWDEKRGQHVLVLLHVEVEPTPEPIFDEFFYRWMKDRRMDVEVVEMAALEEAERQMVVQILTERLLGL